MKKRFLLILFFSLPVTHGCIFYEMGVAIGKVAVWPLEVTTEVTSGFVDGFFGVPTSKEKAKPKTPPPKREETSPPHHEEKKTIHRDKYGNIIPE